MKSIKFITILIGLLLFSITAFTQNISDYLILQDIGSYKFSTQSVNPVTDEVKQVPGYTVTNNSGILMGTDHFFIDHNDKAYETDYENNIAHLGVEVQVTQHTGGDSDRKWLLHEVDKGFRTSLGVPGDQYIMRIVNGNTIMTFGSAGWVYRWISNNQVISIEYEDGQMTKPEPLEVVQAYLAKFPSTLPTVTSADLRTSDNQIKWIKDEMDRRLWLCDKWNLQSQTGSVTQADLTYNLIRSIKVFLNYRQKYFGVAAQADLDLLTGYQQNKNIAAMQTKLTEYKTWWNANKGKSISLP